MTDRFTVRPGQRYFCVVGSPIQHSRSPQIHQAFATQFGISLSYDRVEINPGDFSSALAEFVDIGGRGMNVTLPLKGEAYAGVLQRSVRADTARAANTIVVANDGAVSCDNTDGVGFVRDLTNNHQVGIEGCRVLLLGAGGAARGVMHDLLLKQPGNIVIANRTAQTARELAKLFDQRGKVCGCGYDAIPAGAYDIVINATSLSLHGDKPSIAPSCINKSSTCYDMMYTPSGRTVFLDWCREIGSELTVDGWGMLVEQAAEAFNLWHGVMPDTRPIIDQLRGS